MKKRIVALFVAVVCIFVVTACGAQDPVVGTWNMKGVIYQGEAIDMDSITFVFNEDGTGKTTNATSSNTFTWEYAEEDEEQGLRLYTINMEGGNLLAAGIGQADEDDEDPYGIMFIYHSDDLIMGFERAE